MANSWQTETGTAGQVLVNVNIPYISQSDIYIYIAGTEVSYTWDSATVARLSTALAGGEEVLVMRRTERDALRIQFSEGAAFTRENLDEQNTQFLYLSQELVEGRSIEGFYGDISMNTFRITHLGTPQDSTDAANKAYVDTEAQTVSNKAIRVPETSVAVAPTVAGRKNKLLGFDSLGNPVSATPVEGSATELELELQDVDGFSILGRVPDIATLKTVAPQKDRCLVDVIAYHTDGVLGGGLFEYMANDTTSADDGGYIIVGLNNSRWRRVIEPGLLDITHFGAYIDGVNDDIGPVGLMHAFSLSKFGASYNMGIRLPAGTIKLSHLDLGTTEIGSFHLKGPENNYGAVPLTTIIPADATTTTPMFQMVARRAEISGIRYNGAGTVQPFLKNDVTRGSYLNVRSFVATDCGGRIFQVVDTIDTLLEQVYGYRNSKAFLWVTWSNLSPGAWDHPTAIEIRNANFTSCTGEHVISAIRAGQSLMRNVWFSNNDYTMDISQGGWTWDNLVIEGSVYPVWAQYAKVIRINVRIAQGAGYDDTLSGYTKSMDQLNGGSGNIPSWVTNAYDQGGASIDVAGSSFETGVEMGFRHANSHTIVNTDSTTKWIYLGYLSMPRLGDVAHIKMLGAQGWDSAAGTLDHPGGTGFGGGISHLFFEQKATGVATATGVYAHWYNEGNGPVINLKYYKSWERIYVYVEVGQYARYSAPLVDSNGIPRANAGTPFFVHWEGTEMTEDAVNALANIQTASKRWSINGSGYSSNGIGMDLDTGNLAVYQANLAANYGKQFMPVILNGNQRYIPVDDMAYGNRNVPVTKAQLATMSPSTMVFRQFQVTDGGVGSGDGTQHVIVFSDGYSWINMKTNAIFSTS